MRDVVVTLVVFSILPFALVRPYIGVLLWSWLGYMNPHRLAYGFAYSLDFVKFAAAATIISVLFFKEPKRIPSTGLVWIWLLFSLWVGITTIVALNPDQAVSGWSRFIKSQILILVTLMVMAKQERIDWLVWVIAGSIGFFGIKGGVFTLMTGGNFRIWGPPGSFIEGNNELALALLMVVPLMRYLHLQVENKWLRHGLVVSMLLTLVSVIGSYSRGALVAVAVMLVVLWIKSRGKVVIGSLLVVGVFVALPLMPEKWFERMDTIQTYEEDRSVQGRFNAWWFGFNLAVARPIVGGGIGAYNQELFARYAPNPLDFHDAHSIYFEVLAEQGFVGLGLFLAIGLLVMLTGRNIIHQCRGRDDLKWAADLAAMLQVSFVGYSAGGAFLGLAYFDLPYHLMALMVLTQAIVKRKLDAGPENGEGTEVKAKAQPGYVMADPQVDFGKNNHHWSARPQPEQSHWSPSGGNRDRGGG